MAIGKLATGVIDVPSCCARSNFKTCEVSELFTVSWPPTANSDEPLKKAPLLVLCDTPAVAYEACDRVEDAIENR